MTKPAARKTAAASPFDAFTQSNGPVVETWMQMNRTLLEGIARMQQETSRFISRRLEEDLSRQQQMLACSSPEEAWQVYADFTRQAMQDYADEAGRMSALAADMQQACTGFGGPFVKNDGSRQPVADAAAKPGQQTAA